MKKDGAYARVENLLDVFLFENGLAVDHNLVAVDGDNLAGILVDEILHPCAEHACGELAAESLLEVGLVDLHLLGEVEDLDNVLIAFEADGAQKSGHGELLLAVDVGVHHIIDVRSKLDPRTTEGDDTGGIELCAVGVGALSEEHTRRTVELRNHNALGAVDYESALLGHIGNRAEEHVLNHGGEILVVGVGAIQL